MGCCCVVVAVPWEDRGAGVGGVRFLAAVDWRGWHFVYNLETGSSGRYGSGYGLARVKVGFCFEVVLVIDYLLSGNHVSIQIYFILYSIRISPVHSLK